MAAVGAAASAGEILRAWRQRRRVSQLELSLHAAVSSRHLSFVETGRAHASRELLLHLAGELEMPLRERNGLLLAAGYAPVYEQRPLDADEMGPIRAALDRFLLAHEPYPAVILDRHYDVVAGNDSTDVLMRGVAPQLFEPPANALRLTLHPHGMAPRILNLAEWSAHLLQRLRRQAAATGDPELERLYEELAGYPGVVSEPPPEEITAADILLPLRLDGDGVELSFFSTISTFGTAVDITLAELSIEAFYPADAATANRLLADVTSPAVST